MCLDSIALVFVELFVRGAFEPTRHSNASENQSPFFSMSRFSANQNKVGLLLLSVGRSCMARSPTSLNRILGLAISSEGPVVLPAASVEFD